MKVPTKQQLRDEIEQLKEDLFTAMDKLEDKEAFYKLATKNPGYYHWYFEREAEKNILSGSYIRGNEMTTYIMDSETVKALSTYIHN